MTDDARRYPVGRFAHDGPVTADDRAAWTDAIAALPAELAAATAGATDAEWATPYRPGGWTVRQVVHHIADSHLNAYVRVRLALTEDRPTIRPYDEAAWALLPDVAAVPPATSLALLAALHERWAALLRALPDEAWTRPFVHPTSGETTVERAVGSYAWHGRHHTAHVRLVRAAGVAVRPMRAANAAVLREALYHAIHVPPGAAAPPPSVVDEPALARYVAGWPADTAEAGVVAEADGAVVGAAWLRRWAGTDRGYGFVDAATPELSMAVWPGWRGRGIGTALLARLLDGAGAVSLSVSETNPARRLYERFGFVAVGPPAGGSVTMQRGATPPGR